MNKSKVDVVIPVYNEEKLIFHSVKTVYDYLVLNLSNYDWKIIIANNASSDRTEKIAEELSHKYPEVELINLELKGRGRALRTAWNNSDADILSYMDVDLSTDLSFFPIMIDGLINSGRSIATGTRLTSKSKTTRGLFRETLSRGYNLILKVMLDIEYSDAQCGFKAITRKALKDLVPLVKDNEWFFDTELLTLAEKYNYGIYEVPVIWIENVDSRVEVLNSVYKYLKDVLRFRYDLSFSKDLKALKKL